MSSMRKALIVSCLLLAGCVTASVTRLTNEYYAPTLPADVVINLAEEDIPGEYDEIALIFTKGDYASTDESDQF